MNHYHFIVWAAEGKTEQGYSGVTYVDVICETVNEAIVRAKQLCPDKAHYWVNSIVEHHPHAVEQHVLLFRGDGKEHS